MSVSPPTGYLTKKEIEEEFHRSHRSLTRDFSQAVRVGDSDILRNLKLRTDDGKEFEGTKVTLELIQELSNQGLSPTWYARREWVQEHYGKESAKKQKKQSEQEEKPATAERLISTSTDNELITTLRSHITRLEQENDRRSDEHQQDKQAFMEQIKMFKDMFDTLKEDHTDTKELLKEVHQVMGKFADVSLLGSQREAPVDDSPKRETPSGQDVLIDLRNDAAVDAVVVDEPKKTKKGSAKQGIKKNTKKKPARVTKPKGAAAPKTKPSAKAKPKSPKWYETPTLNRFISRKPRK
ncbi:hypothetical protein [Gimesia fumaroli]|uniref:Uncharacterized protein n=1 Tax=Gimesia fumaroli TaxID=2527976 RepID=A0A518I5U0_9PLAN|nr:hypothetical protein [Gimesia fumaroli]QDV48462.1 hypothetical protein Enr17x_04740 [Gimesia fumaroli]